MLIKENSCRSSHNQTYAIFFAKKLIPATTCPVFLPPCLQVVSQKTVSLLPPLPMGVFPLAVTLPAAGECSQPRPGNGRGTVMGGPWCGDEEHGGAAPRCLHLVCRAHSQAR